MAKRLECPLSECHATIEAETERDVMARAERHLQESHPGLKLTDEMARHVRERIRDV